LKGGSEDPFSTLFTGSITAKIGGSIMPIIDKYAVFLSIKNPARLQGYETAYLTHQKVAEMKDKGYDGTEYVDENGNIAEYSVFDSEDIKSISNIGTFDSSANILKENEAPYGEEEDDSFDFGANIEREIEADPEKHISLDFKDHLTGYIGSLYDMVAAGEPGKRLALEGIMKMKQGKERSINEKGLDIIGGLLKYHYDIRFI